MRKTVVAVIAFSLVAWFTQWAVIRYFPELVFKIAVHRTHHQFNHWINAGKTDANMRSVVMPNPDFVYSALFYDINDKPVTISGILPDSTYASVSFYDNRCQPYYVYNNLDSNRRGKFEFTLVKDGILNHREVPVKTSKGIIICRFLKSTDSGYQQLVTYQKTLSCVSK